MKYSSSKRLAARALVGGLGLLITAGPGLAAQFTEPDVVIFGKVLNVGNGGGHQLYEGTLMFTMVSSLEPTQVITRTTDLYPVGSSGEYSYRHRIKMFVQAERHEVGTGIEVSGMPFTYSIINATLDGYPVTAADPAQLRNLVISSSSRGSEFQVDLQVSRPETDSDGDGMPDWWEDLHDLNKLSAADASADPDGDGLTNLDEFKGGTDPNVANFTPQVMDTTVQVPVGGTAGLLLNLVAQGVSPENLYLSFTNSTSGVTWMLDGSSLPVGTEFSWQEMRDGRVSAGISESFSSGPAPLKIRDATPGTSNTITQVTLRIQGFSPKLGMSALPSLWFSGGSYVPGSDWTDLSGNARVAYQPSASAQPGTNPASEAVMFTPTNFLYVDDRQWSPEDFTALVAFNRDAGGGARQTLFNSSKIEISIAGDSDDARNISIRQNRRAAESLLPKQSNSIVTVYSAASAAWVDVTDQARYFSLTNTTAKPGAYTTIGAMRTLTASTATNFFKGGLKELVFFDNLISIRSQGQLQDYLLSRWDGVTVWNHRAAVLPVTIHGAVAKRNSIAGGFGDDVLEGEMLADILRGGPGSNDLTGGDQGDRFVFEPNESNDMVQDFDMAEGDVLDLNAIFAGVRGNPSMYVNLRPVVVRGVDGYPQVDTVIEVSYSGNVDSAVDQTITIKNVSLEQTELLNYMAMGSIQLGGLSFNEPAVASVAADRVLAVGQSTWLEVVPTDSQPTSYRWQFNGIDIPGGGTNQLHVAPTNRTAEGYYTVIISNQYGSVTSSPAFLKVMVPQQLALYEMGPDGSVMFMFRDQDGFLETDLSRFDVQWTTNFTGEYSAWVSSVNTLTLTNGYIRFMDPESVYRPRAVYRVIER